MKSWTNKVFFFSSNSISFILLTRANLLYIHTGNELEEVLEGQLRKFPQASRSPQAPRHAEIWANDVSIIDLDCSEIETFGD